MRKLILLLFISSCVIQQLPTRKSDDGYSSIKDEEKAELLKFDFSNFNRKTDRPRFEEVNTGNISEMIRQNNYSLIFLWAPWCPHSYNNMPECIKWFSGLSGKGLNLIMISQYYDLKTMKKYFSEFKYDKPFYILDNSYYGNKEALKHSRFKQDFKIGDKDRTMVPSVFLFDSTGVCLYEHMGELHSRDTVLTLSHIQ